ncbi:MAG TPA: hypothetical protein VGJ29_06015 [Vicinamibacterales bacterium]|jgi:hypothetical protein
MRFVIALCCAAALAAAACGESAPAAPSVAPATITETFTGTVAVSGSSLQSITVNQVSKLTVTLTSVDPSAALGIGIGSLSNGTCVVLTTNSPVVAGGSTVLSGTALAGTLCVTIYDVGNLVEPVTYTISVAHS